MVRRSARIRRNAVPVQGQWDILPHGMGILPTSGSQPMKQAGPLEKTSGTKSANNDEFNSMSGEPWEKVDGTLAQEDNDTNESQLNKNSAIMREGRAQILINIAAPKEHDEAHREVRTQSQCPDETTTLRRSNRIRARAQATEGCDEGHEIKEPLPKKAKTIPSEAKLEANALESSDPLGKPKRTPRKTKDNPYGLTPGRSPFPEWQAPSAAQCEEVYWLLASIHGEVKQPATIPAPSLEVAGCGEVPSVLDALLRTLLSGAVTFDGADNMVKAIIRKYGTINDELAAGSINWNRIRLSTIEELGKTIYIGGLANRKSTAIKGILDMVYQDNLHRREAYLVEKATGVSANVYGASQKTQSQKDLEILKTDRNILSLDHLLGLSVDEAMKQFTKFPGIGVKTAACVILFCLQQPCFAVDTHVHRFSRWLGWTPPKADENDTFSHLEVRCPDHLKYGLHQLFIHHGKQCGRCKMSTVEGTKEWETVVCPLEHLLVRGKRVTKVQKKPKKMAKAKANGEGFNSQEDDIKSDILEDDSSILGAEQD
ncbi:DNA glycosylase [Xylaria bambusicola]|uniref:DNA glycosylase n=1 Tax=Xylaria bambusicola TaxID=326684 RepID=UPI0020086B61|nr:DNA glycosylase [Xylaria bambusicola]KAI0522254.1 DNA glycosylase [Xylaria bambusicola]